MRRIQQRQGGRLPVLGKDCWKLQHPDYEPVMFGVNAVPTGWEQKEDVIAKLSSSDYKGSDGEDEIELSSISSSDCYSNDRSALWFPYTALRDFWFLTPLNFFRGYMNHESGSSKRHTAIIDGSVFDDPEEDDKNFSGYFPGR